MCWILPIARCLFHLDPYASVGNTPPRLIDKGIIQHSAWYNGTYIENHVDAFTLFDTVTYNSSL